MEIIDVMGRPCPIPVIEAKKALSKPGADSVVVLVDNLVAVQNLEKLAVGNGFGFSYKEKSPNAFEAAISLDGKTPPERAAAVSAASGSGLAVLIGKDRMGEGAEELGKILIKGFIYSLTELPVPPTHVIFLNSGAHLTAEGANTVSDLQTLEDRGVQVLTCGTCISFYGLTGTPAVGGVTNMYGITEALAGAANTVTV